MRNFLDYTRHELAGIVGGTGRAKRLYQAVYQEGVRAVDGFDVELPAVTTSFDSSDGTRRSLLRLHDGQVVESVLIPEPQRATVCVSSQVGCALACQFCLTGRLGLTRNLSAGEIVSQVMVQREPAQRLSVVFMGMGEPLQNYENVMTAIQILSDDCGLALPLRRITVSTAGLLPALEDLAKESIFPNLSISLTGATNELRDVLMPINRRYPIEDLIGCVRRLPHGRQKYVMFEYVMMKGITDSVADAERLAGLLAGLRVKVNLIPLNEASEISFERAEHSDILRFQQVLLNNGVTTFIRKTRGQDVSGACGQLKRRESRRLHSQDELCL